VTKICDSRFSASGCPIEEIAVECQLPLWGDGALPGIAPLSLRYRTRPYFQALIAELRKWPLFRRYWFKLYEDIERDPVVDNETITVRAPQVGKLHYFSTSFTVLTSAGTLVFYTYIPADAKTTAFFADVSRQSERVAYQFGDHHKLAQT
jgi:hypothetical protein